MSEKLHTQEPWGISPDVDTHIWNKGGDIQIAACNLDNVNSIANARRIVACVNALEGVATDRLETANTSGSGFWGKCIHDADVKYSELAIQNKALTAQRDELLAALKECKSFIGELPKSQTPYGLFRKLQSIIARSKNA